MMVVVAEADEEGNASFPIYFFKLPTGGSGQQGMGRQTPQPTTPNAAQLTPFE
jgi:hypothetical protein